jgi:hypothetical protein
MRDKMKNMQDFCETTSAAGDIFEHGRCINTETQQTTNSREFFHRDFNAQ